MIKQYIDYSNIIFFYRFYFEKNKEKYGKNQASLNDSIC